METIKRILQERITNRIEPGKAVLIFGARRVGKTVLMRKIVDGYSGRIMMLNGEDYDTLALLENRSVANYRHLLEGIDLLAIDEAQNIPQIGSILKLIVDEIPGISVLASGSSSFDLLNKTGEPLVGRSTQFLLTPFSQQEIAQTETALETVTLPHAPEVIDVPPADSFRRPPRLSLAIRGVGGQGNLFFGKVLAQVAFLAGYDDRNILKGETHGMAQMGGPVISTFGCGEVFSPALVPGTANVLIAMEKAEVLRPGFLDLLEPGGTVLMADTRILPHGLKPEAYPSDEAIAAQLEGYRVVSVDVLSIALNLGDPKGRCANVAMLGVLSTLPPFDVVPEAVWLQALRGISRKPALLDLNHAAFMAGRGMQKG